MGRIDPGQGRGARRAHRRRLRIQRSIAFVVLVAASAALVAVDLAKHGLPDVAARAAGAPITVPTPSTSAVRPKAVELRTPSLSRYGVPAAWVATENAKLGTTAWQISGSHPGFIEGFADHIDAQVGDRVGLYVSTNAATFTVAAYRMGYYGGAGAREVWSSGTITGAVQPACPVTRSTNMVACDNWSRSTTFAVTNVFPPGDYLLKLVGDGGQQSWVMLGVTDPKSRATYLLVARSLTEQGWNTYGGFSFYEGTGPCILSSSTYPVCNRARVVSFDRPYAGGNGPGDFLANEYPLVRFVEQHSLDVAYVSDVTLDSHPEYLLEHKAILSLGHDETWTYAERKGVELAVARGVNVLFFGAASVLRHARMAPSPLGPARQEVDYRNSSEDPLDGKGDPMQVTGNTWGTPPASLPADHFIGQVYSGYLKPGTGTVPLVVYDAFSWLYRGTGLQNGSAIPGVITSDFDHIDGRSAPANLEVVAHSPIPLTKVYTNQGRWGSVTYSDMTYYTDPVSHAGVFDTGNVNWINTLTPCEPGAACPAPETSVITGNLLWLFGQGPTGVRMPSVPNWQQVGSTSTLH